MHLKKYCTAATTTKKNNNKINTMYHQKILIDFVSRPIIPFRWVYTKASSRISSYTDAFRSRP